MAETAICLMGHTAYTGVRKILLGNRKLMEARGVDFSLLLRQAEAPEADGKTVMFVALDGQAAGLIAVADTLKEYSVEAVQRLHKLGLEVAMVGDGVNDAPALAQAEVSMAIGSGTDAAKETGDIILIKDDIRDVVVALEVGKATMRKVKQNLFWAFIYNYNSLGIPLAAGLFYPFMALIISPELAGLLMAISSITATLNTLLLKGFRPSVRTGEKPRGQGQTRTQQLAPASASTD